MSIKFSRSTFNEQMAQRLVAASPEAVTPTMAGAASDFLTQKMRELQLTEPRTDGLEIYKRVLAAHLACARLVVTPYLRGYAASVDGIEEEAA